jgi:hypothetical protein
MLKLQTQVPAQFEYVGEYTICNLDRAPSMNKQKKPFAGTFREAVELARLRFVKVMGDPSYDSKKVTVCDKHGLKVWFKIEYVLGCAHETNYNDGAVYRKIEGAE